MTASEPSQAAAPPFKNAEAWLAARGITREPVTRAIESRGGTSPGPSNAVETPLSVRDATRLIAQSVSDAELRAADDAAVPDPARRGLEDDVTEALAFVRRSTSSAPQSEGRIRSKLAERGWAESVIEPALVQARRERLVDDAAMAAALVAERRAKGHAVPRIRRDLRERGFDPDVVAAALGDAAGEDQEAAAFAVARDKAQRLTGVAAETAFRRVVGHVARRGYPEGLARKVAREAVFVARDPERTAGH